MTGISFALINLSFCRQKIDGEKLLKLNNKDIVELKLTEGKLGPALRVTKLINDLQATQKHQRK